MLSKLLSLFKTFNTVSVRGATTVNKDTKEEIEIKTNKLLQDIFSSNNIKKNDIISLENKYLKFIPYTWQLLEMRMSSKSYLELKKIFDSNIPKKFRKKIIY